LENLWIPPDGYRDVPAIEDCPASDEHTWSPWLWGLQKGPKILAVWCLKNGGQKPPSDGNFNVFGEGKTNDKPIDLGVSHFQRKLEVGNMTCNHVPDILTRENRTYHLSEKHHWLLLEDVQFIPIPSHQMAENQQAW